MTQSRDHEDGTDYVTKMARLEAVVAAIQSPDISIDEAIAYQKEGSELAKELEVYLKNAEVVVRDITGKDAV